MKRILCIVGSMNAGGAETFLMKLYRNIDRTKYQMDFCVAIKEPGIYDNEIKSLGGKILYTTPKSKGAVKSFMSIRKIVSENKYEYVMRVSQHSLSGIELIAAKLGGAKTTIFRSSNTQTGGGFINRLLHKICLPITKFVPDIKIAPSTEAADFMFGKNSIKKRNALILPNALDINLYMYDKKNRAKYREELDLKDKFVIGHVGRLTYQKNHDYLIDIFAEIKSKMNNSVLLIIGKGELRSEIEEKVEKLSLTDSVMFLGVREDIPQLLSAMDVFIFPSFFEGMPNTVIEAQTSGLPCIISDTITKEAAVTQYVKFLSLNDSVKTWASKVLEFVDASDEKRKLVVQEIISNGYNIENTVKSFVDIVFE
ncbi:TPA: glycosyltransferase family 1 protein [Clostridium perfringens]